MDLTLYPEYPNQAMKIKQTMGTRKPIAIFDTSAIQPIKTGQTAPPTIIITIIEEPFFVNPPRFFIPNAKIVGNIIDMQK